MGMAHRGRLNVLTNIVGKSYVEIFHGFEGDIDPRTTQGSGDVMYHLGADGTHTSPRGDRDRRRRSRRTHRISRPSTRSSRGWSARSRTSSPTDDFRDTGPPRPDPRRRGVRGTGCRPGDAEPLAAARLPHRRHRPHRREQRDRLHGRSGVDALERVRDRRREDDPGADLPRERRRPRSVHLGHASRVRRSARPSTRTSSSTCTCYRRWGHNEADEPAFTQPLMYARIDEHRSVRKLYTEQLVNRGDITVEEAEKALDDFRQRLEQALEETRSTSAPAKAKAPPPPPPKGVRPHFPTGVAPDVLDAIVTTLGTYPDGFEPHPKLAKILRTTPRRSSAPTRSTGRSPRRCRGDRWSSRARPSGCPDRTRGAARSASGTPS